MFEIGKNELERFTDKFGYNKIYATLEAQINNYAADFDLTDDFTLHDIEMKHTRNISVTGTRFEYDAVYEVSVLYPDKYRDEQTKSQ